MRQIKPKFVTSAIYRKTGFSGLHPLAISRIGAIEEIAEHLGWLSQADRVEATPAQVKTLLKFHAEDYVNALQAADKAGSVPAEVREKYNFGTMENPLFRGVFRRAATTVGGSVAAAKIALEGGIGFHPAGGTHHGVRKHASGFCYFNDPVFAILTLLEGGHKKVAYIDLDAHHGDGVELAFADDPNVLTLSVHEENRWPNTGHLEFDQERSIHNIPVPKQINDSELELLINEVITKQLQLFRPQSIVVTCGADALSGDPLSTMTYSNTGLQNAVLKLAELYPSAVILGGGGYNPWTTVRCWTGLWGSLSAQSFPEELPPEVIEILEGFECDLVDEEDIESIWLTDLQDPPNPGPIRDEIRQITKFAAEIMKAPTTD